MTELADVFADLEDPRATSARRHSRHDIPVSAFCAMLCGGPTGADMELFGQAKGDCLTPTPSSDGSWGSCGSLPRAMRVSSR